MCKQYPDLDQTGEWQSDRPEHKADQDHQSLCDCFHILSSEIESFSLPGAEVLPEHSSLGQG
jgi:hypothetical protein